MDLTRQDWYICRISSGDSFMWQTVVILPNLLPHTYTFGEKEPNWHEKNNKLHIIDQLVIKKIFSALLDNRLTNKL